MSKPTLLIVEDEKNTRDGLARALRKNYTVLLAEQGQAALDLLDQQPVDLVLSDIRMPGMDGLAALRKIQERSDVPVIFVTARRRELEQVLGLELGADDYVTKPFSLRELAARVRAVLRRAGKGAADAQILRAADITLDVSGRVTTVGDERVDLTPSEFALLATLMTSPGRTFSRLELLDHLQDSAYEGYERTIDVHIRRLRTKIEPDPRKPRYVETVHGFGYRFAAADG